MPTFSAIHLEQLLEPGTTPANATSVKDVERRETAAFQFDGRKLASSRGSGGGGVPPPYPHLRRHNSVSATLQHNNLTARPQFNSNDVTVRPQMSPALYTTPESTPIPLYPTSSFPPSSPFLINHKRRGPRLAKSFSEQSVALAAAVGEGVLTEKCTRSLSEENAQSDGKEMEFDEVVFEVNGDVVEEVDAGVSVRVVADGGDSDDFFEPQESMSYSSSVDGEDFCGERSIKASTPLGEFYDAWEELSSENGPQGAQHSLSDFETELREVRLNLLMEIEKRKHVEEVVHNMQSQWEMLREKLGHAGLVLPTYLAAFENSHSDVSPTADICNQLHLARLVSESIGRGVARAEVEAEMEAQLEVKNFEIARLCDKLHYYESMNREMSQRNQEAVEVARCDRQKRRRRQKWVWGSIATAITLGSAALAWSYLPSGEGSSSTVYPETSEPNSDIQ